MKKINAMHRLQELVEPDLAALEKNLLLKDGQRYLIFGRYSLEPSDDGYRLSKYGDRVSDFLDRRVALSWCIADKYQQVHLSQRILRLSQRHRNLKSDVMARSYLAQRIRSLDLKENVELKIETKKAQLRQMENELDKCVNLAKYWQIRGFNNETARTGRSPSPRTSR